MTYNKTIAALPMPDRIRRLPVSDEGYPIPWFVATVPETGARDIRIADAEKRVAAVRRSLCWVCGQPLGRFKAFVIGPMCVVNRVTSEPGCHRECAEFSVAACPFLTRPRMRRNDADMPEGVTDAPGVAIPRNPGASCLYVTTSFTIRRVSKRPNDWLIALGPPVDIVWYAQGRLATRAEVMESIDTGFPLLMKMAVEDGPEAIAILTKQHQAALRLVPS